MRRSGRRRFSGTYNMVQSFGQQLRNQSPLNVHRLFEQIRKGGVFGGAQSGIFVAVLSAVETALWDLAGKALNVPVYQLLGGKFRDRIRVYWTPRCIRRSCRQPEPFATGGQEGGRGRLHCHEVRSGSGQRSQQIRPVQLDGQSGRNPAHGGSVDGRPRKRSGPKSTSAPTCTPATTFRPACRWPNAWSRST